MKMIFSAMAKKLFGTKYERLKKAFFIWLTVFWGLHSAGFRIQIAPFILYLMVSTFSAGVMWQALSSEDNASNMKNMFMLPFENRQLVFAYVSALGGYTLLTKTAGLLAVVLAVSPWSGEEIAGSILCGINAVLMTACVYSCKRYRAAGALWAGAFVSVIFISGGTPAFLSLVIVNILFAMLLLNYADAYSFYTQMQREKNFRKIAEQDFAANYSEKRHSVENHFAKTGSAERYPGRRYPARCIFVWRYLFRYLAAHKNYLVNTMVMWGAACALPVFLGQMDTVSVMPVGFAILSLNTPLCILLSSDPALEQAVRFLPGQKKAFCIPYSLFIFACNMTADVIFLCSWQIQVKGVTGIMVLIAVFFAWGSAVASVLLEWYCPVRGWKIESDLWHHPRKYVVPAGMLLTAGALGMLMA